MDRHGFLSVGHSQNGAFGRRDAALSDAGRNDRGSRGPRFRCCPGRYRSCSVMMHDGIASRKVATSVRPACSAFDCSRVRNTKSLVDQIKRALVRGLSRAGHQHASFDRENATRFNSNNARTLFAELPAVHMHLIPRPDRPWGSLGDAGTVATAAAPANAVPDAAGQHCGYVPLDPDSVKAII